MMQRHSTPRNSGRRMAAAPLRRAIERLGADDLRQQENAAGGLDLIERIAHEIDETVLPRAIALVADAGEVAELTVSNRRLVGLKVEAGTAPRTTAKASPG